MAYVHNTWYDKSDIENRIPLSTENLNNMEDGIQEALNRSAENMKNLVIERITSSCTWTAPKAVNNMFKVFCVGGGGGGGKSHTFTKDNGVINTFTISGGGGGGGHICIEEQKIEAGTNIDIVCGSGGAMSVDGGSTMFGDDIIAEGGKAGEDAFIENGIYRCGNGGNGGAGGGGGGFYYYNFIVGDFSASNVISGNGGNGSYCGGGGGGAITGSGGISYGNCGNGGTYGIVPTCGVPMQDPILNCLFNINNIPLMTNQELIEGYGSGGIGGNGGTSLYGGGGGYCGNGGNGGNIGGGGGGGGYCGNGGNGYKGTYDTSSHHFRGGGGAGGGGFFCDGGTTNSWSGAGGGGFYSDGSGSTGGNGGVLIMYIKDDTKEEE